MNLRRQYTHFCCMYTRLGNRQSTSLVSQMLKRIRVYVLSQCATIKQPNYLFLRLSKESNDEKTSCHFFLRPFSCNETRTLVESHFSSFGQSHVQLNNPVTYPLFLTVAWGPFFSRPYCPVSLKFYETEIHFFLQVIHCSTTGKCMYIFKTLM